MRKYLFIMLLVLQTSLFAQSIHLERDATLHKEIKLIFNDVAVQNNEYLIFEINRDFDFGNLVLKINGRPIEENIYKVYAKSHNVNVSIDVTSKEDAEGGDYNFFVKLKEASNNLKEGGVEYKGEEKIYVEKIIVPQTTQEQIKTCIVYGVIALLLLLIAIFFYKKSRKFTLGYISFLYPHNDEVALRGKSKYTFDTVEKEIVFELVKGKDGMPKIKHNNKNYELSVNGDIYNNVYQIRKDDKITINDGQGLKVAEFVYY